MYTYECWDVDRAGFLYRLKVRITYNKKGERSDTVILVKHLGMWVVLENKTHDGWITLQGEPKALQFFARAQDMSPEELGAKTVPVTKGIKV